MVSGIGAVAMIVMQSKVIADWFRGHHFMLAISISVGAYPVGVGLSQVVHPLLAQRFGLAGGVPVRRGRDGGRHRAVPGQLSRSAGDTAGAPANSPCRAYQSAWRWSCAG